jgi:NADH-quinone oxidoreductase subunit N
VGIPPLAGFVGKLGLFTVAIDGGATWLAVAAIMNTVVSLFYYLRAISTMVLDAPSAPAQTLGAWSAVALAFMALLVLLLGIVAPLQGWPMAHQGHLLAP